MAATEEALGALHELTARTLAQIIKEGVPIVNRETGEIEGYAPAPAPYIAAAIKFLKDNQIEALAAKGSALRDLSDALPDFSGEEDGLYGRA